MLRAQEHPGEGIGAILETIERKVRTALYAQARERWDCFAFMLIESDFAGHRYWKYFDPDSPQYRAGAPAQLRDGLPRVYGAIDEALGRVMAADPRGRSPDLFRSRVWRRQHQDGFSQPLPGAAGMLKFVAEAGGPARSGRGSDWAAVWRCRAEGYRPALSARGAAHSVAALDENRQPDRVAHPIWRDRLAQHAAIFGRIALLSRTCGSIWRDAKVPASCRPIATRKPARASRRRCATGAIRKPASRWCAAFIGARRFIAASRSSGRRIC